MRSARTTPKATKEKRPAVRTIRLIFSRALMNANPPTNDLRIVDTERKKAAPAYSRSRIRIMSYLRKCPSFLANSTRQINEVTLICPLSSAGELSRRCAQSFRLGNTQRKLIEFRCRALSEGIRVMLAPNKRAEMYDSGTPFLQPEPLSGRQTLTLPARFTSFSFYFHP
jgi:hypothetical protein